MIVISAVMLGFSFDFVPKSSIPLQSDMAFFLFFREDPCVLTPAD